MVILEAMTWDNGQVHCESMQAHLVTITSVDEEEFVRDLFSGCIFSFWIGYNDKIMEGNWEWVTGEPKVFEDWIGGEPSNQEEDCAFLFAYCTFSGMADHWDDQQCDRPMATVCEKGTTSLTTQSATSKQITTALTTQFSTLDTTTSATSKQITTALTTQFSTLDTTKSATSKQSTTAALTTQFSTLDTTTSTTSKPSTTAALTTQFSTLDTTTSTTSKQKLLQFFGIQVLGKAGVKSCLPPNHLQDLSLDVINTRSIFMCCKLCMSQRQCNAIQIQYQSKYLLNCYILIHAGDSEQYQQHHLPCAVFNLKQI
ncbi:cell wall integrity and stress response component 4-like isoform X7 [Anneissia japonica]|uniref:cell wall integrity and stress response component 4-like isoform X7 n=1 Tax=Anneissia japonica TaxID=1529436 RepID=UPI0014254F4F|nr:cell wall integrity and stress response component 4-like isoform X7 [Anneissia japonica]